MSPHELPVLLNIFWTRCFQFQGCGFFFLFYLSSSIYGSLARLVSPKIEDCLANDHVQQDDYIEENVGENQDNQRPANVSLSVWVRYKVRKAHKEVSDYENSHLVHNLCDVHQKGVEWHYGHYVGKVWKSEEEVGDDLEDGMGCKKS